MPQLNSDQILFVSALFNVLTYVAMVWKKRRNETLEEGQRDWKFQAMWEDFKERKHIKARNGGTH